MGRISCQWLEVMPVLVRIFSGKREEIGSLCTAAMTGARRAESSTFIDVGALR
ncbi:MAG: hypothetical protein LUE19_03940 [Clostridiales bacterium]|nr:hypothetical protein [Clostridiales bacterium]